MSHFPYSLSAESSFDTNTNRSARMAESSKNEINRKHNPKDVLPEKIMGSATRIQSKCQASVHRVPQELRKLNESAYTPSLVSIGPLHSEEPHLQSQMRDVKLFYMSCLLRKVCDGQDDQADALQQCLNKMEESIPLPKVKNFYAEGEVNAIMLLIDGCFILELLRRHAEILTEAKEKESEERRLSQKSKDESRPDCPDPIKSQKNNNKMAADPIFSFPLRRVAVQHDLLLLENQLPLLVLTELFHLTLGRLPSHLHLSQYILNFFHGILNIGHKKSDDCRQKETKPQPDSHPADVEGLEGGLLPGHLHLSEHILNFFHGILNIGHKKSDDCRQKETKPQPDSHPVDVEGLEGYDHITKPQPDSHPVDVEGLEGYDHILQFLHSHYLPDPLPKHDKVVGQDQDNKFLPFASHLDSFGVKFEGNKDQFEVQFEPRLSTCRRARFSIPTLHIGDSTELVLRNFIAFEKCVPHVSGYFTSYAYLLDGLINTEADVQVLEEAEVIRNSLGTTIEASDLFNNLCKNVVLGEFHFAKICDKVVEYDKHCWLAVLPMTIQHVKRKLSAHPWTFIAFVTAFAAFAMQVIQFITSYTEKK